MHILITLIAFLMGITLLIAFHEFGHFWVARCLGIKVLRFSIGFGRPLWRKQSKKGTEYVISMLPLGGYVKMLDEKEGPVADADLPFAFNRQPLWKRIAVVIAGPAFNILFALFAFWLMFVLGIKGIVPMIGDVKADSFAAQAGLNSHHEILSIGKKKTGDWRSVQLALFSQWGRSEPFGITVYDKSKQTQQQRQLHVTTWDFDLKRESIIQAVGIQPYFPIPPATIGQVIENTPAAAAGLKVGDKILKVDEQPMTSWRDFYQAVNQRPGEAVKLIIQRNEQEITITAVPAVREVEGKRVGYLGLMPLPTTWPEGMIRHNRYSVLGAWLPAWHETWQIARMTLSTLGKMLTGQLSVRHISGPIGIATGAGQSAMSGPAYYLGFLALISVSLAVLNILPIPILDGGHLLYYLIEAMVGRPVSQRIEQWGMRLGLVMLVGLMMLAIVNDIKRLIE